MDDLMNLTIPPETTMEQPATQDSKQDSKQVEGQVGKVEQPQSKEGDTDLFSDINKLTKSYKELQREFTHKSQKLSELDTQLNQITEMSEKFGGVKNVFDWANYIATDPDFKGLIQKKFNPVETLPETPEAKEALRVINAIVEDKLKSVNGVIENLVTQYISPIAAESQAKKIEQYFAHLDTIDSQWKQSSKTMARLLGQLPEQTKNNLSTKDVEALYWRAVVEDEKFDEAIKRRYEAKVHREKERETKLGTNTDIRVDMTNKSLSLEESLAMAEKTTGIRLQ